MGVSAAPARKRSFAGANAHRSAMPSYRPNQGGSTYGAPPPSYDDYKCAPPRLSVNDLCEEAGGAEAPTYGAESDAQFAEEEPQHDAPMAQPERRAAAATTAAEALEEDEAAEQAQPTAVPFLQPVEQRGGLDWFQVCETDQAAEVEPPAALPVTGGKDGVPALEEDGSLHMYWLDAYEDPYNAPGTVYLFGKVRSDDVTGFSSCAVVVKGLERNVFVLPRERHLIDGKEEGDEVTFVQVYQEIQQVCRTHKITRFGCKKVERAYAFEEPGMPAHAEYLKLVYSAEMAALPMDLEGKTFRKIFGSKTPCLERLLLKRKVMGPCWLKLDGVAAINSNTTWCKFEVGLTNKKAVSVLPDAPPPPPLIVASLHVQTVQNAKNQPEIVLASVITHSRVSVDGATTNQQALQSFSVVRKLEQRAWPWDLQRTVAANKRLKLEVCPSERALLNFLIAKLHNLDADVLVGHNIAAYDMGVLLQRIQACKILHWSKVGRMRMRTMPKLNGGTSAFSGNTFAQWSVVAGRLMCDTFLSAQELLPSQRSYALKELAYSHLNTTKVDVDQSQVAAKFEETQTLLEVVRSCENDAFLSMQLMFKMMVLPLTKQLTNLAGNLWCKSLQGKRAERIEFLLLHEFHRLKYVVPDKETFASREAKANKKKDADRAAAEEEGITYVEEEDDLGGRRTGTGATGRKKAAYAGGLVLEPKRGFYDRFVLLLDFNSLYPSIVQEYNICFTTVTRPTPDEEGNLPLAALPSASAEPGVLPRMIGQLVARRKDVRSMLKQEKDGARKAQLDIRQKALKIMANSMYGCLGFSGSRFHCQALAQLITSRGRDALMHACEIANNNNAEVIYGDTDSVMIHSGTDNLAEARKMANALKGEINKHYRCMEIDIDGVMKCMLLLKKKKYAALMVEEKPDGSLVTTRETKGLDLVRRDWCTLSRQAGSAVLDFILSGKSRDEVVSEICAYLSDIKEKVDRNELGIEQYIITKQLTKAPQDYPDAKSQPHVCVANAMIEQGEHVGPGAVIEYVICVDQSKSSVSDRAYHPKTVLRAEGMLQVDTAWYMAQQLHPPIWRLCEPIEGIESAQVAECLGLDPAKFHRSEMASSAAEGAGSYQNSAASARDLSRFAGAEPLTVTCADCGESKPLRGVLGHGSEAGAASGASKYEWLGGESLKCGVASCGAKHSETRLSNSLTLAIRKQQKAYYTGGLQCDENSCRDVRRSMSTHVSLDEAGMPLFPVCTVPRCSGKMTKVVRDQALHTQLLFLKSLFDLEWGTKKIDEDNKRRPVKLEAGAVEQGAKDTCERLKKQVVTALDSSAYHTVNLANLFNACSPCA